MKKEWLEQPALFGCCGCCEEFSREANELRVFKDRTYCEDCFTGEDHSWDEWEDLPVFVPRNPRAEAAEAKVLEAACRVEDLARRLAAAEAEVKTLLQEVVSLRASAYNEVKDNPEYLELLEDRQEQVQERFAAEARMNELEKELAAKSAECERVRDALDDSLATTLSEAEQAELQKARDAADSAERELGLDADIWDEMRRMLAIPEDVPPMAFPEHLAKRLAVAEALADRLGEAVSDLLTGAGGVSRFDKGRVTLAERRARGKGEGNGR